MKKIEVEICLGTACFVMGANKLQDIGEQIPASWKEKVDIKAVTCLDLCANNDYAKAPFVKIDGEVMSEATIEKIINALKEKIENN